MSEWKKVKLGDLFERVTRKNTNLESDNVLTISAQYGLINQEEFFNKSVASKNLKNYYLLKKGEFAYNKSYSSGYPMGATKMLEKYDEGIVSTLYICFRSKSDLVNNEYFKYYFESIQYYDELSKITQEGARNHGLLNMSVEDFFNIQVILLPIKEQAKIVKLLKEIDYIIKKYEKLLKEKNQFIKSQFLKMFNKYEKTQLFNVANIIMGQSPNSNSYNDDEIGMPFYQGKADYGVKYTITRHWTTTPCKIAEKGDILMSVRAPVGPVNIASTKCCIGRGLCAIQEKNNITNNEFLYNAINVLQDEISKMGAGSTFNAITKNDVYNILIPKAPISIQNKFAEFVKQVDKQKLLLEQQKQNYENLKKGLMQKLLTGKIRVKI